MIVVLFLILILLKINKPADYLDYLISLVLLLGLFSIFLALYLRKKLCVEITSDKKRHHVSDDITFKVRIMKPFFNTAIKPIITVKNLQLKTTETIKIERFQSSEHLYHINGLQAGTIKIEINRIAVYGIFGIFKCYHKAYYHTEFNLYPDEVEPSNRKVGKLIMHGDGEVKNAKGDNFFEPYEIREMTEQDDMRHIHRSLSAKYDEYMVKVGSDSQRIYYLYRMQNKADFLERIDELGQVIKLKTDVVNTEYNGLSVTYKGNFNVIATEYLLYRFIDKVYADYVN